MEKKRVLQDVPKVAFAPIHDGEWEFTPFPSCLKSVLAYLGDKHPYHYLLSTCGGAFRLLWHSKRWEGGNVDIIFIDEDPLKPFRQGLNSVGYSSEMLFNGNLQWDSAVNDLAARDRYFSGFLSNDADAFRKKIVSSIDSGKPVIAFGVVGPPEASIITGYDNDGDILIGWSLFQDHLDPIHDVTEDVGMHPPIGLEECGYFRQNDWFEKLTGIIILGEKSNVDRISVYLDTLAWIPEMFKTPMVHEFYSGFKAYDVYMEKMSSPEEFPSGNMEVLAERKMVHYDAMTMIAERDGGGKFLADIAECRDFAAAKADLTAASEAFTESSRQMRGWWKVVGNIFNDENAQVRAVGDQTVREAFLPYINRSKDLDRKAVEHIEQALYTIKG